MAHAVATYLSQKFTLHRFDRLDSTNAEALRNGAPHGHVYVAQAQEAGRGRQGREWISPAGNLYITICVEVPEGVNPAQLAFVAGLGVLDTVAGVTADIRVSLKWPNDVLLNGKKVAGILIEAGQSGGYAVGIGINLAHSPSPAETRFPATSILEESGVLSTVDDELENLCTRFSHWYRQWGADGFEPLRAVWLASAHAIGDTIAASIGTGRLDGRFDGLDADGALLLTDEGGRQHVITAGDVILPGNG
ncbi:MAG: biotin--[acetyl-CoA-carboxylase] ligase [Pseudomonadota bacterium]|nr:biotin--[acetyl-CoA-carboxylase] ligase [Pseudomonadota bacterium]